jgi:3D (Asp-Asp-Asp) domain-containing protein
MSNKIITQDLLTQYRTLKPKATEYTKRKKKVDGLAKAGVKCEYGEWTASVEAIPTTVVPWKDLLIEHIGEAAVAEIEAEYAGKSVRKTVRVFSLNQPV